MTAAFSRRLLLATTTTVLVKSLQYSPSSFGGQAQRSLLFSATAKWRMASTNDNTNMEDIIDTTTTTKPSFFWTACPKCHGEGKISKSPSRKARLRYKRAKLENQEGAGTGGEGIKNDAAFQPQPPSIRMDPCTNCKSTGIIQTQTPPPLPPPLTTTTTATNNPKSNNYYLPRVAIVGGGLGGLALGIACQHRCIPYTVFERDTHFSQRSSGYGLTLQQASGALAAFGILDLSSGGITSTKHVVHTPDGTVVGEWGLRKWGRDDSKKGPPKRQNVHIARQALRYELLQSLTRAGNHHAAAAAHLEWNHKLLEYRQTKNSENGKEEMDLLFQVGENQVHYTADIVVGADGIRSQVRQQLIGDSLTPLRYLNCLVVLGICSLDRLSSAAKENPLLDGQTVFQTADGNTRIYVMPYSSTEYMWQLSFPMDKEDDAKQAAGQGAAALKAHALEKCDKWHDPIMELLQQTPTDLVSGYPVYDRTLLTTELLRSKTTASNKSDGRSVTLLGDAAHPMSPFKGQGANQALLDALSLARAIYKTCRPKQDGNASDVNATPVQVQEVLELYQEEMTIRSAPKVQASAQAANFLHTDVAIQEGNVTRGAAAAATNHNDNQDD
jgi:salicylate hydroxylase